MASVLVSYQTQLATLESGNMTIEPDLQLNHKNKSVVGQTCQFTAKDNALVSTSFSVSASNDKRSPNESSETVSEVSNFGMVQTDPIPQ